VQERSSKAQTSRQAIQHTNGSTLAAENRCKQDNFIQQGSFTRNSASTCRFTK